jgi:hypothetical protein
MPWARPARRRHARSATAESSIDPDGKLVVAEVGAKRMVQIDPQNVTEIAGNLPIGLVAAPGGLPTGVGATGVIYFSSDIENAIYKITKK